MKDWNDMTWREQNDAWREHAGRFRATPAARSTARDPSPADWDDMSREQQNDAWTRQSGRYQAERKARDAAGNQEHVRGPQVRKPQGRQGRSR